MENFFHRQIQLWGEEKQESLKSKKIVIIGSGGLGCSLAFALGSIGIGEIIIVDFDTVSVHNIHRQIALRKGDEGKPKVEVVKEVIENRTHETKITTLFMDFASFTKENIQVDLILDATDNLFTRKEIDEYSKKINTPWIYASVEAFHGQVCFFDKAKFEIFSIKKIQPAGIAAPIVMQIASTQANFAIRYLIGMNVPKDTLFYTSYNNDGVLQVQKFPIIL